VLQCSVATEVAEFIPSLTAVVLSERIIKIINQSTFVAAYHKNTTWAFFD